MGDLIRRISKSLRDLTRREHPEPRQERRRSPRLICSAPVIWEVGREQGEGQLRELTGTGLKLWSERAIVAGKHIRVRPLDCDWGGPLTIDIAIGKVIYSRVRDRASTTGGIGPPQGRYEIGIELINPERISRFAWVGRLARREASKSPLPEVFPVGGIPKLRLLKGHSVPSEQRLLRAEFRMLQEEKNSKI